MEKEFNRVMGQIVNCAQKGSPMRMKLRHLTKYAKDIANRRIIE